jgi:hypothetical protein
VAAESPGKGHGGTFYLQLPLYGAPAPEWPDDD